MGKKRILAYSAINWLSQDVTVTEMYRIVNLSLFLSFVMTLLLFLTQEEYSWKAVEKMLRMAAEVKDSS